MALRCEAIGSGNCTSAPRVWLEEPNANCCSRPQPADCKPSLLRCCCIHASRFVCPCSSTARCKHEAFIGQRLTTGGGMEIKLTPSSRMRARAAGTRDIFSSASTVMAAGTASIVLAWSRHCSRTYGLQYTSDTPERILVVQPGSLPEGLWRP